jgi:tetratricopeptide repeat protein
MGHWGLARRTTVEAALRLLVGRLRVRLSLVGALLLVGLLALVSVSALADGGGAGGGGGMGGGGGGGGSAPVPPADPAYTAGVKAIERGNYAEAIRLLEGVVAKDDRNADAYNWLGYATRQSGDAAKSIALYQKALAIDPKHRGAHEYLGEAYLVLGDLPKAREHLAALNRLCFFSCEQYRDLKEAVQAYEASGGQTRPKSKGAP